MSSRRRLSAVPDAPRLAVISLRVSRVMGRDGDSFHAPDLQEDACRRFCAERGWHVVGVVTDLDVSGGVFDRPGLNEALRMLEAGDATALVTYDVSRLGRKVKETLEVIDRVRTAGGVYASVKERFDDTPEGEHLLHTFLSIAHLYRRQRGRGWQEVIARRAEQGWWHGSNPPCGYLLEAKVGLRPDPLDGPLMAEAFRRYAAEHLVSHIARDLSSQRGKVHAMNTLKRQLGSPVYIGQVPHGDQVFAGRHEALVDEQTWELVQRRLARDRRTASRHLAVSHSLVGLVVCDHCDRHLQLHVAPPRAGQVEPVPRLQCRRRLQGGPEFCVGPGTPQVAEVEAAVLDELRRRIVVLRSDGEARAAQQARRARAGVDVGRLRRELDKTEASIGTLTADRARREITQQAYQLTIGSLERAADGLRRQLEVAQTVRELPAPRGTVAALQTVERLWPVAATDEKNRMLRKLVGQVRVRRAVSYREPLEAGSTGRVRVEWL